MESDGGVPLVFVLLALLSTVFWIYCAVKTAMNGRWVLFVLGWFCGIAWIIGAFSGPAVSSGGSTIGMSARQYDKMRRKQRSRGHLVIDPARRANGACPACGKPNQTGQRCAVCGTYLG